MTDQTPTALLKTLLRDHHRAHHPWQIWATCEECRDHYEALARHLALAAAVRRLPKDDDTWWMLEVGSQPTLHPGEPEARWTRQYDLRIENDDGVVGIGSGPTLTAAITEALGDD